MMIGTASRSRVEPTVHAGGLPPYQQPTRPLVEDHYHLGERSGEATGELLVALLGYLRRRHSTETQIMPSRFRTCRREALSGMAPGRAWSQLTHLAQVQLGSGDI
jgi:hypothetical protein